MQSIKVRIGTQAFLMKLYKYQTFQFKTVFKRVLCKIRFEKRIQIS